MTAVESNVVKMEYGSTIAAAYGVSLQQGFYRINETDIYGNVDSYIVYVDLEAPTLTATADGNTVTFTSDYIQQYEGLFSYSIFDFTSFVDNADKYAAIKVNGRGLDNVSYLLDDNWNLPVLTYDNGYYGRYTISVYDRSGNVAVISLSIAGQPPEITTSSLSNNTRLTITVSMNDSTNALTQIRLYKINYDGSETLFENDDAGNKITVSNLSYVLTNGGYYRVEVTDIYNRRVESSFFYRKGLPTGVLNGVEEGGITSRNVTLTYNVDCSVELYEWIDDEWQDVTDKIWVETSADSLVALLEAVDGRWAKFKWFLFNTSDRSLFIEYEFSMKCVLPQVVVTTSSGTELSDGALTKENFSLNWEQEDIRVVVEQVNNKFAGTTDYTKGTVLSKAATYLFTVTDSVKNRIEITVTLDNKIDFTMEGNYKNCNGTLTSKYWFRLTANEETRVFELTSATGNSYVSGTRIEEEGLYNARIIDLAGNELQLKIAIDRTAPNVNISTVDGDELAYGSVTNQSVYLSTEQGATISYTYLGTNNVYNGELLEGEGRYSFVVSDAIGNLSEFTLRIKKTLTYTISGKYVQDDGKYISGNWLRVEEDEDFAAVAIRNSAGVLFGVGARLTAEDTYVATIVDIAGNKQTLTLVIDLTPPTAAIVTENGNYLDYGVITNQNYYVLCEEQNVTVSYTLSNETRQYRGELLTQEGRYDFIITDIVGNAATFRVTIKKSLQYTVSGKYVQDNAAYVSANWLRLEQDELFASIVIVERTSGTVYAAGDRIEVEGEYVVSIEDVAGNTCTLTFVIDKTAPEATVITTDGTQLQYDGITNQSFTVTCDESGARITQKVNDSDVLYDGKELTEEGVYVFTISDVVGNAATFKITVRKTLTYVLSGTYIERDGRFVSNNWLRIENDEMFDIVSIVSEDNANYTAGDRLTEEGVYYVSILDVAGNLVEMILEIDKTVPSFTILSEDGSMIAANGATNNNFYVVVDEEDVVVSVSMNKGGFSVYDGETITEEGSYVFQITDAVGNAVNFSLILSKQLIFTVSGNYVLDGDRYISASWLRLERNDNFASVSIVDSDGIEYSAGQRIDIEGSYYVNIADIAGNATSFILEIDKTAPNVAAYTNEGVGIALNSATNKEFTLSTQEKNVTIVCSFDGSTFDYEGEMLNKEGLYTFTVTDVVGNTAIFTMRIQLHLEYNVVGAVLIDGNRYVSNNWLRIDDNELLADVVIVDENGSTYNVGSRIDIEGVYYVTLADVAGNTGTVILEIDKTAPEVYVQTLDGASLDYLLTNREVVVLCDEEDSTIYRLYDDGSEVYNGQALSDEGEYQFVVYDNVGNSRIITLRIKKSLTFTVTGYLLLEDNRYISNNWLFIDDISDLKEISIVSINGEVMDASKRISSEGVYVATIYDLAGNTVSIELEIDKTPPEIAILTESGMQIAENSVINQPFSVRTDEKGVGITCTLDSGEEITEYTLFTEEGTYRFVVKDRLNNTKEFTIRIKTSLTYNVLGKYVQENDTYSSATWLQVEEDNDLSSVTITNDTATYGIGERVSEEGTYTVNIEDVAGNTCALTFVIDKTAPDCIIKSESGAVLKTGTVTNQSVSFESGEQDVVITYSLKNETQQEYNGGLIIDEGRYTVIVVDKVGNQSTASITIDKSVAVQGIAKSGQIYSDSANITFSENVVTKMTFNGEPMDYPKNGRFTTDGQYTLTATDNYGNSETWVFEIVRKNCQTFTHEIDGFDIAVTLDGEQIPIEDVSDDSALTLTQTGNYFLVFSKKGEECFTLELSIHNTPPKLEYECDGRSAMAQVAVKGNYTVALVKDGKQINYELGNVIKNNGNYTLTVTDEYGNVSECSFVINYLNGFGIAVIVIISLVFAVVVFLLIRSRRIKAS
ncbi:MAG: hypothetical protein NC132_06560 [Corallococcus sp.]|nr:hypothetical protein [Corallococcus sp.]